MTDTKTQQTPQTLSPETLRVSTWEHAAKTIRGFAHDPLFIEQLHTSHVDPSDTSSPEYATALSIFTDSYIETQGNAFENPKTVDQLTLLANTPSYLHMQNDLNYYEHKGQLSAEERQFVGQTKQYVIWYNQRLGDYIYANSNEEFVSIKRPLTDIALRYFPQEAAFVEKSISETARGARTEAVTRNLLDIANIKYRPGDINDDMHGGDFVLEHKGKAIRLDIKSSLDAIAKIRGGYDKITQQKITYAISKGHNGHKENDNIVLFPGFTDATLGGKCRLSDSDAISRAAFIQIQIEKAFKEMGL